MRIAAFALFSFALIGTSAYPGDGQDKKNTPATKLIRPIGQKKGDDPKKDESKKDEPKKEPEKKAVPPVPKGPPEFEIRFADDSTVRANLLDPAIVVTTKYGKLTIPISEIRRIELGFRYPEGVEAKVNEAVTDLGAADFAVREAAEKTLLDLKEFALPAVRKAAKSPDKEVVKRAESLLAAFKEKLPDDRKEPKEYDTVETGEFTFQGKVETAALKARTKYFAESSLKVAELRGVRMAGVESSDAIVIDSAKYGRPNDQTWLETNIELTAGKPLEISVSGTIDLWPQQGGQYIVGPNGQPQHGSVQIISPTGRAYQFSSGTVIGRVGPQGEPFVVGIGMKSPRINSSGKLYFKIAGSPWGNPPSGSYKATVKAGN
jgi:hypothetical protein